MSRVGKAPIKILAGVKVEVKDNVVKVEGPKGKLSHTVPAGVSVKSEGGQLTVVRDESAPNAAALHGLTRTLVHNMVHGVHTGFTKELDIVGVGYRAAVQGKALNLTLGFSHPVVVDMPEGITIESPSQTEIIIKGTDKQRVGQIAAEIRNLRPPEPYKGKGVRYAGEQISLKEGKKK